MSDDITRLLDAARHIKEGEGLTTALLAETGVSLPLRLLVAAVALIAADQPVTKKAITTAAPAARSAAYRDYAELLGRLKDDLPSLVSAQLAAVRRDVSVTELAAQLARANETIATERARRAELERQLVDVANYARELHWELRPVYEANLREKTEKVRQLRPVPPVED